MDQVFHANRSNLLKVYNKSEKDIESDVNTILATIRQQAHFPTFKEETLRRKIETYLIYTKFHYERTKKQLDLCYAYRHVYPEFFDNWDVCSPEFENNLDECRCLPLPYLTTDLYRITLAELTDKFVDKHFEPIVHMKIGIMSLEMRFQHDHNVSDILLFNCSKVNMGLIKKFTPSLIKKISDVVIKGYSFRLAGAHLLYPPSSISILLNIFKLLIKPKLYERIHLHSDLESLHKVVPKELLPKNYGGDLPDSQILADRWYEMLRNNRANLIEESKMRTDESKRIDKLNDDEFFGSMHGSFKKLEFD
ncbi:alpha-tocopherol transfer protein-like [Chrysoperla carnea]|uniref:alpha-tocopherol transfer protein-like n=1 Tax=Chrysoperla carnea TaxID=189513 RepID=UPI001D08CE73|nr:alpha-tocopherol transfer protein-like [Chrysoperla carnea]